MTPTPKKPAAGQTTPGEEKSMEAVAKMLRAYGWVCIPPGTDHDHHFVVFERDAWYTEHSIQCRLAGEMAGCGYHHSAAKIADDMNEPDDWGRYKIIDIDSEGLPSLERAAQERAK